MKLSDFRSLDPQNPGGWPSGVKVFFSVIVFALIVGIGWYVKIRNQQDTLTTSENKEKELRVIFEQKQAKVVNLEKYKAQLEEMKNVLRQMLRQLPSKTEMPDLLVDISQTALSSGIENELFQPGPEVVKEFYAEKPIQLRMLGTYHQFGTFVSGVASLPRVVILTMHDISLKPSQAQRDPRAGPAPPGQLVLEGTVKTYRYVEEEDEATPAGAPGKPAGAPGAPPAPAAGGS